MFMDWVTQPYTDVNSPQIDIDSTKYQSNF